MNTVSACSYARVPLSHSSIALTLKTIRLSRAFLQCRFSTQTPFFFFCRIASVVYPVSSESFGIVTQLIIFNSYVAMMNTAIYKLKNSGSQYRFMVLLSLDWFQSEITGVRPPLMPPLTTFQKLPTLSASFNAKDLCESGPLS